jgi:hypothetical protein
VFKYAPPAMLIERERHQARWGVAAAPPVGVGVGVGLGVGSWETAALFSLSVSALISSSVHALGMFAGVSRQSLGSPGFHTSHRLNLYTPAHECSSTPHLQCWSSESGTWPGGGWPLLHPWEWDWGGKLGDCSIVLTVRRLSPDLLERSCSRHVRRYE